MLVMSNFLDEIAYSYTEHNSNTDWYKAIATKVSKIVNSNTSGLDTEVTPREELLELGSILFPYFKMGAVSSNSLLGLDELILFAFYKVNQESYKRVLDLGANIGLHTLVLQKLGFFVKSFEPDLVHFEQAIKVLNLNQLSTTNFLNAAVAQTNGIANFVRVLGNTTASHIEGSKSRPAYGELQKFQVPTVSINQVLSEGFDLVKMDIEGFEAELLQSIDATYFKNCDFLIEVGSAENASSILNLLRGRVNLFSQKSNWNLVKDLEEMPKNYKEGSLFITSKTSMPWG
jgi:FkbM family methyltransferase